VRAELAKVRYLPLPRWTAAVVAATAVIVGIVLIAIEPDNSEKYVAIPSAAVGTIAEFAAIVFAVWLATLEFSSGTMQRTLTAEPNRSRVLTDKLVVVLVAVVAAGLLAAATAGGLSHLAANHAGIKIDNGELAGQLFGSVPAWAAAAAVGFGFGLLARAFGGGIAAGLVFVLAFDGLVSFIPGLKYLTFGQLTHDLTNGIGGLGETENSLGVAILGTVVWCALIVVPGWIRFLRSDLK
jgi:ABC-2 type transport system permease protein